MNHSEAILRDLLEYLEVLANEPSHLSKTKLDRERLAALILIARGWRRLAGNADEDIDILADVVGRGGRVLSDNLKSAPGRPWESKERALVETDQLVMADIRSGMRPDDAIRKIYGEGNDFEANQARIRRLRRDDLEIIALQTPDKSGH